MTARGIKKGGTNTKTNSYRDEFPDAFADLVKRFDVDVEECASGLAPSMRAVDEVEVLT